MRDVKLNAVEYSEGETVPDWLFTLDPTTPRTEPVSLVFAQTVRVIELNWAHVVVPDDSDKPIVIINVTGEPGKLALQSGEAVELIIPADGNVRKILQIKRI